MSTLLLRFAGPMQSWGVDSKFNRRNAGRAPSKSGVVGLCAAALGYRRDEESCLERLINLKIGIRVDKPGKLISDFHMAHQESFWDKRDRSKISREGKGDSYLSTRYYLSDAAFLVGLEGDEELINEIDKAIKTPMFPLFLGRRSCPPEGRVSLGVTQEGLLEALKKHPLIVSESSSSFDTRQTPRIVMDYEEDSGNDMAQQRYIIRDLPQSFKMEHRKYFFREVCEFNVREHDPFAEVEEVQTCT